MSEKRTISIEVTQTPRGVKARVQMHIDGRFVKSVSSTRLWGKERTAKAPDLLLFQQLAGACSETLKAWTEQQELPF